MSKIKRRNILQALQDRLKTITVDNGYMVNIVDVKLDLDNYTEKLDHELPIIYILPDTERADGKVGGRAEKTWTIDLFLVAKNLSHIEIMDIVDDMEDCILGFKNGGDHTLGCNIRVPRIVDLAVQGQANIADDDYSLAVMTIELLYITNVFRQN